MISGAFRLFEPSAEVKHNSLQTVSGFILNMKWLVIRGKACVEPERSGLLCTIELTWNMRAKCCVEDGETRRRRRSVKGYIKGFFVCVAQKAVRINLSSVRRQQ